MSLQPGTLIGKYVVRRKVAEGGMAEVFLASSRGPEGFEKEVAIKRVLPSFANDPDFVQMFISEARLASRLNHANLVHIFDFDKHENTYYLAMEFVRGKSLWEVRKRCKELMVPVPPTVAAQIALEIARGLHYAHRLTDKGTPLGLVHRDVTPHNILLSYDGAVKLTDFGIAKAGTRLTAAGTLKGKFAYMAPEQARGEAVDNRTDIFALGIVLWELLTGGRLFDGDSDIAVLRAVQNSVIPPPARLNPDVSPALDAAVMTALAREATDRFQTAHDFERALGQYLLEAARHLEDTDVGGFLRRLFVDAGSEREPGEGTQSRSVAPAALAVPEVVELGLDRTVETPRVPERREPTAILGAPDARERVSEPGLEPGRELVGADTRADRPAPVLLSPDEDAKASTLIMEREVRAEIAVPLREPLREPPPTEPRVAEEAAPEPPPAPVFSIDSSVVSDRDALRRSRALPVTIAVIGLGTLAAGAYFFAPRPTPVTKVARVQDSPAVAVASPPAAAPTEDDAGQPDAPRVEPAATEPAATEPPATEPGAPTPSPREAQGILKVRIVGPWAEFTLDGKASTLQGTHRLKLSPGSHHVVIHQSGGGKFEGTIQIQAGQTTTLRFPKNS